MKKIVLVSIVFFILPFKLFAPIEKLSDLREWQELSTSQVWKTLLASIKNKDELTRTVYLFQIKFWETLEKLHDSYSLDPKLTKQKQECFQLGKKYLEYLFKLYKLEKDINDAITTIFKTQIYKKLIGDTEYQNFILLHPQSNVKTMLESAFNSTVISKTLLQTIIKAVGKICIAVALDQRDEQKRKLNAYHDAAKEILTLLANNLLALEDIKKSTYQKRAEPYWNENDYNNLNNLFVTILTDSLLTFAKKAEPYLQTINAAFTPFNNTFLEVLQTQQSIKQNKDKEIKDSLVTLLFIREGLCIKLGKKLFAVLNSGFSDFSLYEELIKKFQPFTSKVSDLKRQALLKYDSFISQMKDYIEELLKKLEKDFHNKVENNFSVGRLDQSQLEEYKGRVESLLSTVSSFIKPPIIQTKEPVKRPQSLSSTNLPKKEEERKASMLLPPMVKATPGIPLQPQISVPTSHEQPIVVPVGASNEPNYVPYSPQGPFPTDVYIQQKRDKAMVLWTLKKYITYGLITVGTAYLIWNLWKRGGNLREAVTRAYYNGYLPQFGDYLKQRFGRFLPSRAR